jgi:DNA helicase-2/ATP-dependent DNA helicase PcrA
MELRAQQRAIVAGYCGGKLAISAVPGSGKTQTLAALAAHLLTRGLVSPESEVLVVTFTNSAVENVRARIYQALKAAGAREGGFRVLTLHSLANAIVQERPDLAGVAYDYRVDDELSSEQTLREATEWVIQQERTRWQAMLADGLTSQQRREAEERWHDDTARLAGEVVRTSKNLRLSPDALLTRCTDGRFSPSPFLQLGAAIYARYDQAMRVTGRLDFDDLLWAAVRALNNDDDFRRRLGQRWPFILEDEAQDSTPLQEAMLALLSRDHGNWVRVGDPNQAIMTSFTASDVRLFRSFKQQPHVTAMPLSVSGRSALPIIQLANALAQWATRQHPEPWVRDHGLSSDVLIQPTPPGDSQPNPVDGDIQLRDFDDEEKEASMVANSAVRFVLQHPDRTCAILTPTNAFGHRIAQVLQSLQARYPDRALYQDQLRNPHSVRRVARALAHALRFCSQPTQLAILADVRAALAGEDLNRASSRRFATLLRSAQPESLLFPQSDDHQLVLPPGLTPSAEERSLLRTWARFAAEWLRASLLPLDQLVLAVAQQIFGDDADLAIAHSLAASLRRYALTHPQAQIADAARELAEIAENRQRYPGNSLIEASFQPAAGQVTLTTMHKAKGLEWDRVYLTRVDDVEFPHTAEASFRGQIWYLDGRDPALEARTQLETLAGRRDTQEDAIKQARLEYIAERLRLLYVGITRARRDLRISFSRQRRERAVDLALAVRALGIPARA